MMWFLIYSFLGFLILMATSFMIFDDPRIGQTMDYIVAVGTVALAIIAVKTIQETSKTSEDYSKRIDNLVSEMSRSRMIEYTRLQIDELYMPLVGAGNRLCLSLEVDGNLYNLIKQKMYLGEPALRQMLDDYTWTKDLHDSQQERINESDRKWSNEVEKEKEFSALRDSASKMVELELDIRYQAEVDLRVLQERMASILTSVGDEKR